MNAKQMGAGIVAGTIVAMILGYVVFDLVLGSFYDANMGSAEGLMRETQQWWASIIGTAAYVVLILLYLGAKSGGNPSLNSGLVAGATVGLLIWATADFIFLGIMNMNTLTLAIVDPIAEAVRGGATGAVIGLVAAQMK